MVISTLIRRYVDRDHWASYPAAFASALAVIATVLLPVRWVLHGFDPADFIIAITIGGMALLLWGVRAYDQ